MWLKTVLSHSMSSDVCRYGLQRLASSHEVDGLDRASCGDHISSKAHEFAGLSDAFGPAVGSSRNSELIRGGGSKPSSGTLHAVQVVAALATEASGPSYSVRRLAEAVGALGVRSEVYTTDLGGAGAAARARVFPIDRLGGGLSRRLAASPALSRALRAAANEGAVLHGHGLWLLPNLYPAWAAARGGAGLIVSPRGMLAREALQFSPGRKWFMWALAQKRALQSAACLHATSEAEAQDIRDAGLSNPIAIIPNGIDLPEAIEGPETPPGRTILHLGRIHPKKGIDQLIAAWAQIEPAYPNWRLRIIGPSEGGHGEALQRQAAALGLSRVDFQGPLFGAEKDRALREADIFVLPTRNENFGLVVAEALAAGTPVICTRGAPWGGLESEGCGWWIDYGAEPLAQVLTVAMAIPQTDLAEMGARGRSWMSSDFSWDGVAGQMMSVYRWVQGGGDRPACVV